MTDLFQIHLKKEFPGPMSYQLFFSWKVEYGEYITGIRSSAHTTEGLTIEYHFPMPPADVEVYTLTVTYVSLVTHQSHTISTPVRIYRAQDHTLEDFQRVIDLRAHSAERMVASEVDNYVSVALSLMNFVFTNDRLYHSHLHYLECNRHYCSDHGSCSIIHGTWKHCSCDRGFAGSTCAFKDHEEQRVHTLLENTLRPLEHIHITNENIVSVLEVVKAIATLRHVSDENLMYRASNVLSGIVSKIGETHIDKLVVNEIITTIEALSTGLTSFFYNNPEIKPSYPYSRILSTREILKNVIDILVSRLGDKEIYRNEFVHYGLAIHTLYPHEAESGEHIVVDKHIPTQEEHESTIAIIPKELFKTIPNDPIAIVAFDSTFNPHEVIMADNCTVISSILSLSLIDKRFRGQVFPKAETEIHVYFEAPGYDFKNLECAMWDSFNRFFTTAGCAIQIENTERVGCTCNRLGEYALVIPKKGTIQILDPPTPPILRREGDDHHEGNKSIEAPFWIFIITIFAGFIAYAFMTQEKENDSFTENITIHPIYSILFIHRSSIPKIARVHLLLLTIVTQMVIESAGVCDPGMGFLHLMFIGVLLSIPFNYLFGVFARLMTTGEKVISRYIFFFLAELIMLIGCIYTHIHVNSHPPLVDMFRVSFFLGIVFDFLVLDSVLVLIANFAPVVTKVARFRGFYSEYQPLYTSLNYKLIQ
eukprot:TRINITY_DN348_c0_g3_i2.p1 TRINITY_DN348_c0_g3~~TRINITY_DN348_c0_g3_i2.p1  ORF type:complete len:705 (+),score=89.71 TRINITY_DN348_c0_g3_i2:385-2499(+)